MRVHIHTHTQTDIQHVRMRKYTHPPPTYTHSAQPATKFIKSKGTTAAEPYPASGRDVGRLTRASTSPTQHTESGTNIWALLKNVPVSSEVLFIPL